VMQTARSSPASAASRMASAAPDGATKITDAVAPVACFASRAVSKSRILWSLAYAALARSARAAGTAAAGATIW
jgi:hypothetical protein